MTTVLPKGPAPSAGPAPYKPRRYINPTLRPVLLLIAHGHTNRIIGRHLGRDEETVKSQVQAILRILHVDNRAQAVAVALRLRILRLDEIPLPPGIAHHHPARRQP
ncbi:LuxR C-terminal-related transcriptional regulator [Streptomyces zhihengii]